MTTLAGQCPGGGFRGTSRVGPANPAFARPNYNHFQEIYKFGFGVEGGGKLAPTRIVPAWRRSLPTRHKSRCWLPWPVFEQPRPPVWLMRQAGRYLPEYRALRRGVGSFLELCYSPDLAVEITLQPIRRYGFDAAILFSDILVVPDALGADVRFVEGEGPQLEPLRVEADLARLGFDRFHAHLAPVYETVRRLAAALPPEVALIGFAGAPGLWPPTWSKGAAVRNSWRRGGWPGSSRNCSARLIDLLDRGRHTLSRRADRGRRRGGSTVRQLGRRAAGAGIAPLVRRAHPENRQRRCGRGIRTCRSSPSRAVSALPMRRSPVTSRSRESAWIRPCR